MKIKSTKQKATKDLVRIPTNTLAETSAKSSVPVGAGVLPATKKKSTVVNINIGPLSINERSFKIKPKFDFGAQIAGTGINFGLGDVRDGINIVARADLTTQTVKGGGKNMEEFLRSLEFEGPVAEILNEKVHFQDIVHFFTSILAETSKLFKIENIHVAFVDGNCTGTIGTVAGAGVSLGWKDEEGYRMMGASGTLLVVGGGYRVGLHESRPKIKTIFKLALGGASFRFVLYVKRKGMDGLEAERAGDMRTEEVVVTKVFSTLEDITVIPSTVESAMLGMMRKKSEQDPSKEGAVSEIGRTKAVASTSRTVESARTGGKGGIESKKDAIKEIAETQIPVLLKEVGDNVTSFVRSIGDALESSKHTFR